MTFRRVIALDDLWDGDIRATQVDGVDVVVIRIADRVHAFEDRCAHLGFPLSEGTLSGSTLTCAAHHWQYDVASGCGINPATARLARFPVKLEDGQVFVDVTRRS